MDSRSWLPCNDFCLMSTVILDEKSGVQTTNGTPVPDVQCGRQLRLNYAARVVDRRERYVLRTSFRPVNLSVKVRFRTDIGETNLNVSYSIVQMPKLTSPLRIHVTVWMYSFGVGPRSTNYALFENKHSAGKKHPKIKFYNTTFSMRLFLYRFIRV